MKNRILIIFFLFLSCAYSEENHPLPGHWEGNIQLPGMQLVVLIDLTSTPDGKWEGKIDIPAQAAKGLSLENIKVDGTKVSFQIQNLPGTPTFSGELQGEKIAGKFTQGDQTYPFELHRKAVTVAEPHPKKSEQEVLAEITALIKKEMEEW